MHSRSVVCRAPRWASFALARASRRSSRTSLSTPAAGCCTASASSPFASPSSSLSEAVGSSCRSWAWTAASSVSTKSAGSWYTSSAFRSVAGSSSGRSMNGRLVDGSITSEPKSTYGISGESTFQHRCSVRSNHCPWTW
eukprot:1961904-Prymnesium_polylepis.1